MLKLRLLEVDLSSGEQVLRDAEGLGVIDVGLQLHYEAGSWRGDPLSAGNPLVLGVGPFAGSPFFGSNRIVVVFRSPQTWGLHVSAMGGAGVEFRATGIHALVVKGRAEEPSILFVEGSEKGFEKVWVEELGWKRLWDVWRGYGGLRGVWALTKYLLDKYSVRGRARSIVVGPAAARTIVAGLFSVDTLGWRQLTPVIDSAARAGGGSLLLQAHGVAAIVFGGEYDPCRDNSKLCDRGLLDEAGKLLGRRYHEAVVIGGSKYRYDPSLRTGGTFGVNYIHYRDLIPMMAYNTIYLSKPARLRLVNMVLEHLWKPVQEEVFGSRSKPWRTCGEPCPLTCKKVWRKTKMDYEPSNAMGPLIGVFDAEEVAKLIDLVDSLGLDAIEAGHIVSWIFDLVHRGLLSPEEVGMSGKPRFDPLTVTARDSRHNAQLAREVLEGLIEHRTKALELVAREGLRAAAAKLEEVYSDRVRMLGLRHRDVAIYSAYGSKGYMTPNLYWAPGMVAPVPVPGRYWTNYSPTFMEPEEMAETSVERAVSEYAVDNAGFCRFHRKWVEKLLRHAYKIVYGVEADVWGNAARMLLKIYEYNVRAGAEPRFWESKKTIDMIAGIAAEVGDAKWAARVSEDIQAAREWWERFHEKFYTRLKTIAGVGG